MSYLPEIMTVFVVHLLAVMSPGPDFIMISRNAFVYSRRAGVYSAVGLGLGMLVHMVYTMLGIGLVISKSIVLFSLIKYLGAAYLIYLGIGAMRAKKANVKINDDEVKSKKEISPFQAIKMGFLTNVLNPKATLFFLSLFTQVVSPDVPAYMYGVFAGVIFMNGFGWFAILALFLSHRRIQGLFARFGHWVERVMGGMLVLLGVKVAIGSSE